MLNFRIGGQNKIIKNKTFFLKHKKPCPGLTPGDFGKRGDGLGGIQRCSRYENHTQREREKSRKRNKRLLNGRGKIGIGGKNDQLTKSQQD